MKKTLLNLTAVCITLLCYAGCSHEEHHHEGDGHNHAPSTQAEHKHHYDGDGHDHGNASATDDETERSGHSHKVGRHGGRLAVLGGHSYHAEMMVANTKTGEIVFEITDRTAEKPAAVEAKELKLNATIDKKPRTFKFQREETERNKGYVSFAITDVVLAKLLDSGEWEGKAIVSFNEKGDPKSGNLYKGELEKEHEHHNHDGHAH
ncbi:hypothetical protein FACS189443_2260 [Planctomycetales bacterium]|nr:hypothetical protein FACS189443_2260 [Planctomycetales bacterium]